MCDAVLNGVPVSRTLPDELESLRPRLYCFKYGDKYVSIRKTGVPRILPPLYVDNTRPLPDGYYTYMILDGRIYSVPTENLFEAGSRHPAILLRVTQSFGKPSKFYGAGEFHKQEDSIKFNIMSGSYMQQLLKDRRYEECEVPWINQIGKTFARVFRNGNPDFKLTYDGTKDTLFTEETVKIQKDHLDKYVADGYEVRLFTDRDACITTLDEEKMEQIAKLKADPSFDEFFPGEKEELLRVMPTLEDYTVYRGGRRRSKKTSKRRVRNHHSTIRRRRA
jgi:hypothetical protein